MYIYITTWKRKPFKETCHYQGQNKICKITIKMSIRFQIADLLKID